MLLFKRSYNFQGVSWCPGTMSRDQFQAESLPALVNMLEPHGNRIPNMHSHYDRAPLPPQSKRRWDRFDQEDKHLP
jgi:hypothetical protein